MFPDPWHSEWHKYHPFLEHLAHALETHNCQVIRSPNEPTLQWMHSVRGKVDVIHLHWPEAYYQTGSKYRIGIGLSKLWRFLMQVRMHQYGLVWTVHEIYPHSIHYSPYPLWAHRYARRLICRYADFITVNCHWAQAKVNNEFEPKGQVAVIELGNYSGFYPDCTNREQARLKLGLSNHNTMFLVFGTMRPNRNPIDVIRAFRHLNAPEARLFIVGQGGGDLRNEVEKEAWGDWRIRVFPFVVPNEELGIYLHACDVLVMPGREYTTSAVIMLALSYGKPVIASRYGCAPEMIGDSGFLFGGDDINDLNSCLDAALKAALPTLGDLAFQRSRQFTWEASAQKLANLYREVKERIDKG